MNSKYKVNAIPLSFAKQLGLPIRPTNVGAQKIDNTILDIYEMAVAAFSVIDKANWVRFFEKTFLVANVSPEVVLGLLFLTLSSANIDFSDQELWWRTDTTKKALLTIRRVELVGKKKFAAVTLDLKYKTYVVHVNSVSFDTLRNSSLFDVDFFRRLQIFGLIAEEAPTKISDKCLNFADIFSPDLAFKLFEYLGINNHAIKLIDGQQLLYGSIYSLGPVELETLKAYIETNLANWFIRPSKSSASTPILFDRKSDSFF